MIARSIFVAMIVTGIVSGFYSAKTTPPGTWPGLGSHPWMRTALLEYGAIDHQAVILGAVFLGTFALMLAFHRLFCWMLDND